MSLEATNLDRAVLAVLLIKRGYSIEEAATLLPNGRNLSQSGIGVSRAELLVQRGVRTVLAMLKLGRPAPGFPLELWPPLPVRESILSQGQVLDQRRALRRWLNGQPVGT